MTDEHVNTFGDWPKTREAVRALDTAKLVEFMGECGVEPADFDGCLACYAYQVAQEREQAAAADPVSTCPFDHESCRVPDDGCPCHDAAADPAPTGRWLVEGSSIMWLDEHGDELADVSIMPVPDCASPEAVVREVTGALRTLIAAADPAPTGRYDPADDPVSTGRYDEHGRFVPYRDAPDPAPTGDDDAET